MRRQHVGVVDSHRFLMATRDSGYRNLESAVSELTDNSMQAQARRVEVLLPGAFADPSGEAVAIVDDGVGMVPRELWRALQFGGTTRFNNRSGLGRFGMGLPNSSLSQARRVDVYTWRKPSSVWHTYLDIDELSGMAAPAVPEPRRRRPPASLAPLLRDHGTVVMWRKLDRHEGRKWPAVARRLPYRLGRVFRYFLWDGREIAVNGNTVVPVDPLFLDHRTVTPQVKAKQYGEVIHYSVAFAAPGADDHTSAIEVRFAELPVDDLLDLPDSDKRKYGIANGAGVSIVRCSREIDYGWLLLRKRRENYDDWWRCEISFPPELDELFGVTHTKQGIRPSQAIRDVLSPDLDAIARTLNGRVRNAFTAAAQRREQQATAIAASARDEYLRPVAKSKRGAAARSSAGGVPAGPQARSRKYELRAEGSASSSLYRVEKEAGRIVVTVNSAHEFYDLMYSPNSRARHQPLRAARQHFELLLIALARSELRPRTAAEQRALAQYRDEWGRAASILARNLR